MACDMDDIIVIETADDMSNSVAFTNIGQELVSEALSLTSAWLLNPAIFYEFDRRRTILWGETISANFARRGSGTSTIPTFGSIVQKG